RGDRVVEAGAQAVLVVDRAEVAVGAQVQQPIDRQVDQVVPLVLAGRGGAAEVGDAVADVDLLADGGPQRRVQVGAPQVGRRRQGDRQRRGGDVVALALVLLDVAAGQLARRRRDQVPREQRAGPLEGDADAVEADVAGVAGRVLEGGGVGVD